MTTTGSSFAQRIRAFFFGRDVFISYCYVDSGYAEALAVALQRLRFSVFLGAWGASPGEELSHEVSTAARQSRLLVVVATPASRASGPVEDEIRYFAGRTRPVIPVDLGLDIQATKTDWPALAGTDVIRESHPRAARPSRPVIRRIRNAAKFTRQTARLKLFIAAVFVIVAATVAGAAMWSRAVVRDAQAQVAQARTSMDEARAGALAANAERIRANLLSSGANLKTFFATLRSRAAAQQAQFADADRRIAAASAEREAAIGSYIRMANDASAMLDMQPARLGGAALQAVQATRFLEKRGMRAAAADRILRETLDLLPYIHERTSYRTAHNWQAIATPDGRWIADPVSERTIAVVNTGTEKCHEFSLPEGRRAERVALSDDGTTLAVFHAVPGERVNDMHYVVSVWNLATGARRDVVLGSSFDRMAVSNGGTLLAVDMAYSKEIAIVRVADSAVIASTPRTKLVRELAFTRSGDVLAITGGAESSGMWAWRTDEAPVQLPPAALLVRHPIDENVVAVVGERLQVRNWKAGDDLWSAPREVNRAVRHAAFSADGEQLAFADLGQGYIVSWKKPENLSSFALRNGHAEIVPVGSGAAVVSYGDGSVDWHDPFAPRPVLARAVHHAPILRMVPQANGTVRTVSTSGSMTWWPAYRRPFMTNTGDTGAAAVSSDGSLIVTLRGRLTTPADLVIHDETKWTPLIPFHHDWTVIALGADKSFFAGLNDGRVLRWKAAADVANSATKPELIAKAEGPITALAVGPDGRVAFASGSSISIADGPVVRPLHREDAQVTALAFGRTDDQLAAGMANGEVRLWQRGRITTFAPRRSSIESIAISADGKYVAATAHPQPAAIWRVDRPSAAHELPGDPANTIAFHPTDGTVATAGQSGVVQVWSKWERERPLEVARFSSGSFTRLVRFTDDGRFLLAVPQYGNGAKWVWRNAELVADACRRLHPLRNTGDVGGYDVICAGY